ncbi:MAG: hypothetical protein EOP49_18480, partial [Sphingobacteriales bacterium]
MISLRNAFFQAVIAAVMAAAVPAHAAPACETAFGRSSALSANSVLSIMTADVKALTALRTFCYRVRKYIGAYIAAMGGLDVLIFTAGIGQGSAGVRAAALQGLRCMGIHLAAQQNLAADGREISRISTDDSPVTV